MLVCGMLLCPSAPNPFFDSSPGESVVGVGSGVSSVGSGYNRGYNGYGYPGYGYGGRYNRRYRYPHFYPPIAVLAG